MAVGHCVGVFLPLTLLVDASFDIGSGAGGVLIHRCVIKMNKG